MEVFVAMVFSFRLEKFFKLSRNNPPDFTQYNSEWRI